MIDYTLLTGISTATDSSLFKGWGPSGVIVPADVNIIDCIKAIWVSDSLLQ